MKPLRYAAMGSGWVVALLVTLYLVVPTLQESHETNGGASLGPYVSAKYSTPAPFLAMPVDDELAAQLAENENRMRPPSSTSVEKLLDALLKTEEKLTRIREALVRYREQEGSFPATLAALLDEGFLKDRDDLVNPNTNAMFVYSRPNLPLLIRCRALGGRVELELYVNEEGSVLLHRGLGMSVPWPISFQRRSMGPVDAVATPLTKASATTKPNSG